MSLSARRNSRGFTLIELLAVMSLLCVAASAGTQVDFVDLVQSREYLDASKVDTDTDALVRMLRDEKIAEGAANLDKEAKQSTREHLFLLQLACQELGLRGEKEAVGPLESLADHPDHFVAKRAGMALEMIERGGKPETAPAISDELKALLPEGTRVGLAFPDRYQENAKRVAKILPPAMSHQMMSRAVAAIGNVDLERFAVFYERGESMEDSLLLVVAEGTFYQDAVTDLLGQMHIQNRISTEQEWVGVLPSPLGDRTFGVALVDGRRIAISPLSEKLDAATLVKVARAF